MRILILIMLLYSLRVKPATMSKMTSFQWLTLLLSDTTSQDLYKTGSKTRTKDGIKQCFGHKSYHKLLKQEPKVDDELKIA